MGRRLKNQIQFFISALMLYSLIFCHAAFSELPPAPEDLFLQTPKGIENDVLYSRLMKAEPGSQQQEHLKITYLIARIRGSNYEFIRNDQPFKGARAAQHMQTKYRYVYGQIRTVQEFIDNIASHSERTGAPYLIRIPGAGTFYLRDILLNELRLLETTLQKSTEAVPQS